MRKNLFILGLLVIGASVNAQNGLYIGSTASVKVTQNALVTSIGGLENNGSGSINGAVYVKKNNTTDKVTLNNTLLKLEYVDPTNYGQFRTDGFTQSEIDGSSKKLTKDFIPEFQTAGTGGYQQLAIPFDGFTIGEFKSNLFSNLNTDAGDRWNANSAYKWSNSKARMDQLSGADATTVGSATDYYILPGTAGWTAKKTIIGKPAASGTYMSFALSGSFTGSFGAGGSGQNYFREKYNSYLHDPFHTGTEWSGEFGRNIYQLGNPFLVSLDLKNIGINTEGAAVDDGNYISNIQSVGFYDNAKVIYTPGTGTSYDTSSMKIVNYTNGAPQTGDVNKYLIKPMQAFMIKLTSSAAQTLNFDKIRTFRSDVTQASHQYDPTTRSSKSTEVFRLSEDKIARQVAAVVVDATGKEVHRTYYAVFNDAVSGFSSFNTAQAVGETSVIYTKEEKSSGGEDTTIGKKLYINVANANDFQGKEIPLYVNAQGSLKFEIYEGGQLVDSFSNGKNFYIKDGNNITKIDGNLVLPINSSNYGLYYEKPEGTLGSADFNKLSTVVARKDGNWVVRFAKDWRLADIEVYSSVGQLVHSKKGVNTSQDYLIPLEQSVSGIYVVKVKAEGGKEVVKKIVQ